MTASDYYNIFELLVPYPPHDLLVLVLAQKLIRQDDLFLVGDPGKPLEKLRVQRLVRPLAKDDPLGPEHNGVFLLREDGVPVGLVFLDNALFFNTSRYYLSVCK